MPPPDMMPKRSGPPGAPTIGPCQRKLLHLSDRHLKIRSLRTPFSRAGPTHRILHRVISIQKDHWVIISPKCLPGIPTQRGHWHTRVCPRQCPVTVTPARRLRLARALHSRGRPQERPYMRRTPLMSTPCPTWTNIAEAITMPRAHVNPEGAGPKLEGAGNFIYKNFDQKPGVLLLIVCCQSTAARPATLNVSLRLSRVSFLGSSRSYFYGHRS